MKIISINIRGLSALAKHNWIRQLIMTHKPTIFGIQESKLQHVDDEVIRGWWWNNGFGYAFIPASDRSGGLILIWDSDVFKSDNAFGCENFLGIKGKWRGKDEEIGFLNVYGPHESGRKKVLWQSLSSVLGPLQIAWCVFGDFNEVRKADERRNSIFNSTSAGDFNNFIRSNEPIDIPLGGRKYTRVGESGGKFSKLDRFLVNDGFKAICQPLSVVALDRKMSDLKGF